MSIAFRAASAALILANIAALVWLFNEVKHTVRDFRQWLKEGE